MTDYLTLTTPKGIARYPWLNKPDTKFDEAGVYKVDLVVPEKEAAAFAKKIKAVTTATLPITKELDDQGNATGNAIIKCKVKNRSDWDRKPKLFDAEGNKIDVNIGGGSTIKVNVQVYVWEVSKKKGVMLQPQAVQVIDLVEFSGGGSADDFGFSKEEGFVAPAKEQFDAAMEAPTEGEDQDLF